MYIPEAKYPRKESIEKLIRNKQKYKLGEKIIRMCTESVIDDHWILTAADCFNEVIYGMSIWLKIGEIDSGIHNDGIEIITSWKDVGVKKTIYYQDSYIYTSYIHLSLYSHSPI